MNENDPVAHAREKLSLKRWIAEIETGPRVFITIEFSESSFLRAYWHAEEKGAVVSLARKWAKGEKFAVPWQGLTEE